MVNGQPRTKRPVQPPHRGILVLDHGQIMEHGATMYEIKKSMEAMDWNPWNPWNAWKLRNANQPSIQSASQPRSASLLFFEGIVAKHFFVLNVGIFLASFELESRLHPSLLSHGRVKKAEKHMCTKSTIFMVGVHPV